MIPELLATFVYSCIAGGIIGGGILLIKVYFPKYDIFKIEYFSRKGIENSPRTNLDNELALYHGIKKDDAKHDYMYSKKWFNSEPKLSFDYSQKIDHFYTIDRVVYPSKNGLAIVPRQTHNNTNILALVLLPTVLLFGVLLLIVLKSKFNKKKTSVSIDDKLTKPYKHEEHETKIIREANKCKNDKSQSLVRLEDDVKQHTALFDGSLLPKDQLQTALGNNVVCCLDVEARKIDHTRTDAVVVKDSHVMPSEQLQNGLDNVKPCLEVEVTKVERTDESVAVKDGSQLPSEQLQIVFDNVKRCWYVEVKKVGRTAESVSVVEEGSQLPSEQLQIDLENVNPCLELEVTKVERTDESVAVKDGSQLPSERLRIDLENVNPCLELEVTKVERTDESVAVMDGAHLSSEQLQIVLENVNPCLELEVTKVERTDESVAVKDGPLLPNDQLQIVLGNFEIAKAENRDTTTVMSSVHGPENEDCTVTHKKQSQRKHQRQRKTEKRKKDRNKNIKFIKEKPTPKPKPSITPKQISDIRTLNNDSSKLDRAHEEADVCTSLRQQATPSQKGVPFSLQNKQELTSEHQEHRPLPLETPKSLHLAKLTTTTATSMNQQTASKPLNVPSSTVSPDKDAQLEPIKPTRVTVSPDNKPTKQFWSSSWTKLRPHGKPEKRTSSTENRVVGSKGTLPLLQPDKIGMDSKVKHSRFRPYIPEKESKGTLPLLGPSTRVMESKVKPSIFRRNQHEKTSNKVSSSTPRRESKVESKIKQSKVHSVETSARKLNIQEEREKNATKNVSTLPPVLPARFDWKMDKYPVWGGETFVNPYGSITMTNTCPIDGWIVILHSLYQENGLIRKRLNDGDCKFFQQLEMFYQSGKFNNIKRTFLTLNSIAVKNQRADMFGNEHNRFVKHLHILYGSRQLSRCSSPTCPKKERYLPAQAISWCDPSVSIQKLLVDWMEETSVSHCTESGSHINQKFCDGVRELHRRRFEREASHPLMIPIDAEMVFYTGYVLSANSIPKLVEVLGRKYGLKSITFISETEAHYVCVVRHRGTWLMYDGRQNRGRTVLFTGNQVRKSYIVSTILYELL